MSIRRCAKQVILTTRPSSDESLLVENGDVLIFGAQNMKILPLYFITLIILDFYSLRQKQFENPRGN